MDSSRPDLRAVAVKAVWQQDMQLVHLTWERLITVRTALTNQVRGVLAERGVVFGRGLGVLRRRCASSVMREMHLWRTLG